jgi:hypothetical protein
MDLMKEINHRLALCLQAGEELDLFVKSQRREEALPRNQCRTANL